MKKFNIFFVGTGCLLLQVPTSTAEPKPLPPLPRSSKPVLSEDWSSGKIDPAKWYRLRKQWGQGNFGVVPENVKVVDDTDQGKPIKALQCEAHGDRYAGPITGLWGKKKRVGGVIVSKRHFASGRFTVRMKIGNRKNPKPPGMVPAIWTYGYRLVKVPEKSADDFTPTQPLYHPYLQNWGKGLCFYWSEIDFPEFGKAGEYRKPMYNTFLNKQHHGTTFDIGNAADGTYHEYTTEWRTGLVPIEGVVDAQVKEAEGFYWVADKAVPYDKYWGAPLKKLGPDTYAVYSGLSATHWVDEKYVGENTRLVPAMTGQLNLGVWLPEWAGKAPWKVVQVNFSSIKVWQYGDEGDVRGILTEDIGDSFDASGKPIK